MKPSMEELLEMDRSVPMNMEARVEIALGLAYRFYRIGKYDYDLTDREEVKKLPMFNHYLLDDEGMTDEKENSFLLAFMIFETIMHEDPFMGRETLYKYPFLTEKTKKKIYKESPMYVFHPKHVNDFPALPEYETAMTIFNFAPGYLVKAFEKAFVKESDNPTDIPSPADWIRVCRRLRDDLMNSDKLPFFICWDKDGGYSPKINYFEIEKASDNGEVPLWVMPIKAGKSIFPYHVAYNPEDEMEDDGMPIAFFDVDGNVVQNDSGAWILIDKDNPMEKRFVQNGERLQMTPSLTLAMRGEKEGEGKTFICGNVKSGNDLVERWRNRE